jgi:hypothetical protein
MRWMPNKQESTKRVNKPLLMITQRRNTSVFGKGFLGDFFLIVIRSD